MRHLKLSLLIAVFLTSCTLGWPANLSHGPVNISADVPSTVSLQLTVVDQQTGSEVSSLDFGDLERVGNRFSTNKAFKVEAKINTSGSAYELIQTSSPLARVGGSETLPSAAFLSRPFYDASTNAGAALSPGAKLGAVAAATGSQRILSDPTGAVRSVHVMYTLSADDAASEIPLNQKSGAYSGTVQFTLTTS